MTKANVRIGQMWEWVHKNRGFPFSSSIYLIVGKNKLYDDSSIYDYEYEYELVEISSSNTRIQKDFMKADNWKLLIDIEPNR